MDNPLDKKSVDWSLINIWCCGKFFSSVDIPAHTKLCHGTAVSSYEENKCGTGPRRRSGRTSLFVPHTGRSFVPQNESYEFHQKFGKSTEMSVEEIVSPVKQAEHWTKKRKENAKVTYEASDETYNNSKLNSSKTQDVFTSSFMDTKDLKDTFVDINDVKADIEMKMESNELAQWKIIQLPSCTVIKPALNLNLKVASTELIESNYQNKILPSAPEPFAMSEEVPPVANCVEACEQVEKPRGRPKLNKPVIRSCDQCDYKCKQKNNLRRHQMRMHSGVWQACDQCEYKVRNVFSLKIHVEVVHKGLVYPCEICDYRGTSRANLKLHLEQHEGVSYNCNQCENTYKYKNTLKAHKKSAHLHGGEKIFSCELCDYKAKWKSHVKAHKQIVHEGVLYPCDQCDYKAKIKINLKIHKERKHSGRKVDLKNKKRESVTGPLDNGTH